MSKKKYVLVQVDVLPDVFLRVLKAKEIMASGEKYVSRATSIAGVSRSAFYKYKDCVSYADTKQDEITLTATLLDKTGALQELLAGISSAGAGVVTINQSMPENGAAKVAVTVRTDGMHVGVEELCAQLAQQPMVIVVKQSK